MFQVAQIVDGAKFTFIPFFITGEHFVLLAEIFLLSQNIILLSSSLLDLNVGIADLTEDDSFLHPFHKPIRLTCDCVNQNKQAYALNASRM